MPSTGIEAPLNNRQYFLQGMLVSSIKNFIYLLLVTGCAFIAWHFLHFSERYWLIWSALILSLIASPAAFKARIKMIVLTGAASAAAAFLAGYFASYFSLFAVYLFLITLICMWLGQLFPHFLFCVFIINLFAILSGGLAVSFSEAVARFIFILIGMLIPLALQIVFYLRFLQNEYRWLSILSLWQLKKLNKEIFSCFLQPEYVDNIYLYERRLHVQKSKCLRAIDALRDLIQETKKNEENEKKQSSFQFLQKKLDHFFELLLDGAQLRRRVTDHATFTICADELTSICQEIDKLLGGLIAHLLGKKLFPNIDMLNEKINKLEESYNNILQISSREPLVFLLFIFNLKALSDEIMECYEKGLSGHY